MSQNRYTRTHSYSTSDTYAYSTDYSANIADEDDIELDDDEFLSDGYEDDLIPASSSRDSSEYDSSQYIRRAHHNRLEQKRRAFIRDSYTDLKDVMPEFKGKKLSRANILINITRKVDENRKILFDLRRQYEAKKLENDREEREVMNLERQLSAIDNTGTYLVDMQHSTPPLANIGINVVPGIQRPIVNRLGHNAHLNLANTNTNNETHEYHYADEISCENINRLDPVSNNGNSVGTNSNTDTPSIGSLTDSPINSGTSTLSSNNPPALGLPHQLQSGVTTSEDSSNATSEEITTQASHPLDMIDGKESQSENPNFIKSSPSLTSASHLAPLETSPDIPCVKTQPNATSLAKSDVTLQKKEDNEVVSLKSGEDCTNNKLAENDVNKKPALRPSGLALSNTMTTRRMRSISMSVNQPSKEYLPNDSSPKIQTNTSTGGKRSFTFTTTAGQGSPQTTKRICVTAIGSNTPVRMTNISNAAQGSANLRRNASNSSAKNSQA